MAEFLYNQEITATDINNIAIDLGATDFSVFSNGEPYAVNKLNEITASIVSSGVLNIGNICQASRIGSSIYIADGVIVFQSGAKIRINEPIEISAENGAVIYAKHNPLTYIATIETSTAYPDDEDVVPLYRINNNGELVDDRVFSVARVLPPASYTHTRIDFTITHTCYQGYNTYDPNSALVNVDSEYFSEYTIKNIDFRYLLLTNVECRNSVATEKRAIIDLSIEGAQWIQLSDSTITPYLVVLKEGNTLKFWSFRYGYVKSDHVFYFTLT